MSRGVIHLMHKLCWNIIRLVIRTDSDALCVLYVSHRITTVCNVTVCIDANWKWAKKALAEFKKSTADKRVPSATFNLLPCNTTSSWDCVRHNYTWLPGFSASITPTLWPECQSGSYWHWVKICIVKKDLEYLYLEGLTQGWVIIFSMGPHDAQKIL